MGWLSFGRTASSDASAKAPQAPPPPPPEEKAALSEAEQLDLLVAGARLDDTAEKDRTAFLASNTRHMYADGLLSIAVYTFSGLQHIKGQSNALTLLTMWTVGTTFLVDAGERKYLQQVMQGTLPSAVQGTESDGAPTQPSTASVNAQMPRSGVDATPSATLSSAMAPAPLSAEKLAEQQRKIFMTPTVASWVWMLASFQQFKVHKRLKWCGYSSWTGLACVSYYTTRHMYNLLVA